MNIFQTFATQSFFLFLAMHTVTEIERCPWTAVMSNHYLQICYEMVHTLSQLSLSIRSLASSPPIFEVLVTLHDVRSCSRVAGEEFARLFSRQNSEPDAQHQYQLRKLIYPLKNGEMGVAPCTLVDNLPGLWRHQWSYLRKNELEQIITIHEHISETC